MATAVRQSVLQLLPTEHNSDTTLQYKYHIHSIINVLVSLVNTFSTGRPGSEVGAELHVNPRFVKTK